MNSARRAVGNGLAPSRSTAPPVTTSVQRVFARFRRSLMPDHDRIVFTVRVPRTVSPETWARFLERVKASDLTTLDAFRRLIERTANGEIEP
jgi:hypothetical protein